MRRPLFGAVIAFALGEVAYLYTGRMVCICMATAMLVCGVILFKGKHENAFFLFISGIFFMLGMMNVSLRANKPELCIMLEKNEPLKGHYEFEKYEILTYGKSMDSGIKIYGYGRVSDIYSAKKGYNAVVKMFYTSFYDDNTSMYIEQEYKIMLYGIKEKPDVGSCIALSGIARLFDHEKNCGGFDMYRYYASDNIYIYINNPAISNIPDDIKKRDTAAEKLYWNYRKYLSLLKEDLRLRLYMFTDEYTAGLYRGILLGDKNGIDNGTRQLYRINGIAHILAISGLHISIIGGMLYKLCRRVGMNFGVSGAFAIAIIISYGRMTGLATATLRASIMLILYIMGEVTGRRYDMLTGLGASLLITLVKTPLAITDGGAMLSYTAILGVALGKKMQSVLDTNKSIKRLKLRHKRIYMLFGSVIFSLSVNIATAPVIVYLYYELALYSIFVNMLVIPLMSVVVVSGIVSLVLSYFNTGIACITIMPGEKILIFYENICKAVAGLPFNSINVGHIGVGIIIVYYAVICLLMMCCTEKFRCIVREAVCCMTLLTVGSAICGLLYIRDRKETLIFLDVGQGDGIIIRSESGTGMVIDGGSADINDLGEYTMAPALKYMGMAEVDYWFITHTDKDHISGLIYILHEEGKGGITINNIVMSENAPHDDETDKLIRLARENDINIIEMNVSDYVADPTFKMTCCHPDSEYQYTDKNDASMALSYSSATFDMLFTGDMGDDAEGYMLYTDSQKEHKSDKTGGVLSDRYDVIKIAHHGSKYSICNELYGMACGGYAVISSGRGNSYGHPHDETIQAIEASGVNILRTDVDGGIMFISR